MTSPDIAFKFDEIDVHGKRVVVLTVPAASKVPTSFDRVRFSRIGSSKVNLEKYPDREAALFAVLLRGPATMENTEAENQDLSFARLFTYYAGRGIELRSETFAENLGLLTPDGKFNTLAQLLSDNSHVPVRVSIFTGATKASPLYSVREFGNTCLLISLDRVLDYIDVLKGVSVPVNQKLSDMFLHLHISERSGRGVPKIVEAFGRESYEFRDGSIALAIPFNRIDAIGSESPNPAAIAPINLNRTQQRVLEEMRNDPNVTYNQIAASIGKGKSTINNAVRFLREHGYIERVGSDKAGWWRVL